jgi:nucleotide-binding universal stress UspA family protein
VDNLVVGYDHHPASHAALLFAVDLSRRLGAHVHVVHIVDLGDEPLNLDSAERQREVDRRLHAHQEAVQQVFNRPDDRWTFHALEGPAVKVLTSIGETHRATMIIIGQPERGLSAMLEHLITGGAVSRGLLHHAARPVVVVPELMDSRK